MLARSDGYTQTDARKKASISLINTLARMCYTVQSKFSYYCNGRLPKFMLKTSESPGVYKIFGRNEIIKSVTHILQMIKFRGIDATYLANKRVDPTNISVVLNLIEDFFLTEKHSFCELILGGSGPMEFSPGEVKLILEHVNKYDFLQWRNIRGHGRSTYIGISRRVTPQELCSFLFAVQDNNVRYKLLPPQVPGIDLLMPDCQYNFNINKSIKINKSTVGVQKTLIPIQIHPGNGETFQRSVPYHGVGRGGGHHGNWV